MRVPASIGLACCGAILLVLPARDAIGQPLHEQIDRLVLARAQSPAAAPADDATFVRRVYLDFAGRIPSADEARAFLADASPDKRVRLIDELLDGPEYPRRMSEAFHVMLMERRGAHAEWTEYLASSFAANKPWDRMVREMLYPDPDDEATRKAAMFLAKRLENYGQNPVDLPGLARDIGRLFLGMDLQCAQCHDHLFIDEYTQQDFQGLFTFVGHTFLRTDLEFPAVGEKPLSAETEFMSVFVQQPRTTGPRLPGGIELEIPSFPEGEKYRIPPDPKTRHPGVPRFSPLRELADQLPRPGNAAFSRNAANRLWFLLMGRGLVDPLDLHHSDNPASHPELLQLLADQFAAHGCDVKWLLRQIALSDTYQRSSLLPESVEHMPEQTFLVAVEKPLSAEQLMWSVLQATGELPRYQPPPDAAAEAEDASGGLEEVRDKFLQAFANPPMEPEVAFAPSVEAALFILNDDTVLQWLSPRDGNLTDRLLQLSDDRALADELYLTVLSRYPLDAERAEVADFLARHGDDLTRAVKNLVWALLASNEFCLNH